MAGAEASPRWHPSVDQRSSSSARRWRPACDTPTPGVRIGEIGGVGVAGHLDKSLDHVRVLLGEFLADDPGVEGRAAPLGDVGAIGQHGATRGLDLRQHRVPDIGAVDVAAFPGGGDFLRTQVEDFERGRIDVPVLQRGQQGIVGGGNERRCDLLALEAFGAVDALHRQRFGFSDVADDEDRLDRQFLASCDVAEATTGMTVGAAPTPTRPDGAGSSSLNLR